MGELKAIKFILVIASVLVAASAGLAALRTYQYMKHYVVKGLDDLFRREAQDLLEAGRQLDLLVARCRDRLRERPNHVYAHWYLGRAYYLQERWNDALEEFETVKRISPDWAESVEPYIDTIRAKGGSY